jgi:hypothetical protein
MCKVIAVVVAMHIFGETKRNSHHPKAEISAKKARLSPKLKKKVLNDQNCIWKRASGPQTMIARDC